jgi:Ca2+-binding EF-hand superfamily protein
MAHPRSTLKPSKRAEFEEAFKEMDENQDGRLQKEEV